METVLMCGNGGSPAVRHELGLPLSETVVYAEVGGQRYVVASSLARPALESRPGLTVLAFEEVGFGAALSRGVTADSAFARALPDFCRQLGVLTPAVPPDFPMEVADELRTAGIEPHVDRDRFERRRRVKTDEQLAGIYQAQAAAEAAMEAVKQHLRHAPRTTSEELRHIAWRVFVDHDCAPNAKLTIASGTEAGSLHAAGSGPITNDRPILIDIYPRALASGCWGDLTRTFCRGIPTPELTRMHETVCDVLDAVKTEIRPGRTGHELCELAHGMFHASGYGTDPTEGVNPDAPATFPHILGHGLGLELHEPPFLDIGGVALLAGDVITVEPGLYKQGWGGVRMEDVVLVTAEGYRQITQMPYDLVL